MGPTVQQAAQERWTYLSAPQRAQPHREKVGLHSLCTTYNTPLSLSRDTTLPPTPCVPH